MLWQVWNIGIELVAPSVEVAVCVQLAELLEDYEPVVDRAANGNLSVRVLVGSHALGNALDKAMTIVVGAVRALGIPEEIAGIEAAAEREIERRHTETVVPPVMGVAEIAQYLGVRSQRVSQLVVREDFPEPVVRLKSGPVFLAASVYDFASQWDRSPGRRPKKAAQSQDAT